MVEPTLRTKTISTKLSDEEYERLVSAAGDQSVAEWMRSTLLGALGTDGGGAAGRPSAGLAPATVRPADETVLAEMLALRTILLNLFFKVSRGATITAEDMKQIIDRADAEKGKKAAERLKHAGR